MTLRFDLTYIRMTKVNNTVIAHAGEDVEHGNTQEIAGGSSNLQNTVVLPQKFGN